MAVSKSDLFKAYVKGMVTAADNAYQEYPDSWKDLVKVKSSGESYEEKTYYSGLGYAKEKPEGTPTQEDRFYQGPTKRWTFNPWGLMLRFTREAVDDDRKGLINDIKDFGESIKQTQHLIAARMFMNATNTNFHSCADGKAFCAADHALIAGGIFSNVAGSAAFPSEAALEAAVLAFEAVPNHRGQIVKREATTITCGKSLEFQFNRLLASVQQAETANNATNAVRNRRKLKLQVEPYITDNRWFISGKLTDYGSPTWYNRVKPEIRSFGDFSTGDMLFKMYMRFGFDVGMPHDYYMVPGV